MLAIRRALLHAAERIGGGSTKRATLLRRLGPKMAGDGIWYARSQLVKVAHQVERRKK
jgi:hypothetical protein